MSNKRYRFSFTKHFILYLLFIVITAYSDINCKKIKSEAKSIANTIEEAVESQVDLSTEQLRKLEFSKGTYSNDSFLGGSFHVSCYNGSNYDIESITILIKVSNKDGQVAFSKEYTLSKGERLEQYKNGTFGESHLFDLKPDQKWSWQVIGAKGYLPK